MVVLLVTTNAAFATEREFLYDRENLELRFNLSSVLHIKPLNERHFVDYVRASVVVAPDETPSQSTILRTTEPFASIDNGTAVFMWKEPRELTLPYNLKSLLSVYFTPPLVNRKVFFPLSVPWGLRNYTRPTEHIDSDNILIKRQANALAEGEDDLSVVLFKLANWVEQNVQYNLSTLTADVSQKASWVMVNRVGVCDEMTSLFIALARSLGIPARFVSGMGYTTSSLFDKNWLPHGWAEVYVSDIGWVPFDIAFGEFGYVDATHIKLQDGLDPEEPATRFEWKGNTDLVAQDIIFGVAVRTKGKKIAPHLTITSVPVATNVGLGSYNVIKTTLQNLREDYISPTLYLAGPSEFVLERKKVHVLLKPHETKDVYWMGQVTDELDGKYRYTLPFQIWSEQNISSAAQFIVDAEGDVLTKEQAEEFIPREYTQKSFVHKVSVSCGIDSDTTFVGDPIRVSCTVQNSGNVVLHDVKTCIDQECFSDTVPIGEERVVKHTISTEVVGHFEVRATVRTAGLEKTVAVPYVVLDHPQVDVQTVSLPERVRFDERVNLSFLLNKTSLSVPQHIVFKISIKGDEVVSAFEQLDGEQRVLLPLEGKTLNEGDNTVLLALEWKDTKGRIFHGEKRLNIVLEQMTFLERVEKMFERAGGIVKEWSRLFN